MSSTIKSTYESRETISPWGTRKQWSPACRASEMVDSMKSGSISGGRITKIHSPPADLVVQIHSVTLSTETVDAWAGGLVWKYNHVARRMDAESVPRAMEIGLPDGSGLEACRQILQCQPGMRVVVLTGSATDHDVHEAILAGAHGYLRKEIDPKALAQAVVDVADGKSIFDSASTAHALRLVRAQAAPTVAESLDLLSLQERRVLALVAEGQTNKEIGTSLGLSENTVKNYLGNVFEKLQVKRRSQAASIYVQANPPQA